MSDYEEVIYWFTAHDAGVVWDTDPNNMDGHDIGTYATTSSDNDQQDMNANSATADNIGDISTVELRAFGYGDGGDMMEYIPEFLVGGTGATYTWVPPNGIGNAAYDATWRDITADGAAPSPWTWTDVNGLGCAIVYMKEGKANTMGIATIEIRVTFRKPVQPGYGVMPSLY